MIVDLFMVYQFLRRLATPFNEWKAFKLGIIDERGNILIKKKDFTRVEQRDAFGIFDTMILKLKRLLEKVPGGKSRIASYAAALYLIKESKNFNENTEEEEIEQFLNENINRILNEEIVNTATGTNVAGLPPDSPVVSQSKVLRRKKRKMKRYAEYKPT